MSVLGGFEEIFHSEEKNPVRKTGCNVAAV